MLGFANSTGSNPSSPSHGGGGGLNSLTYQGSRPGKYECIRADAFCDIDCRGCHIPADKRTPLELASATLPTSEWITQGARMPVRANALVRVEQR